MEFDYGKIVINYFKKHPNFPPCKLKDYLKIKKNINKYYEPITSNKQISIINKYTLLPFKAPAFSHFNKLMHFGLHFY